MSVMKPLFSHKMNLTIRNNAFKDIKPPFIILCNHPSFLDWIYMAIAAYPIRINIVITSYYYYNKLLSPLLKGLGAISKDLFYSDIRAVRDIMRVLKMGAAVALFPEGRLSPHGASETFFNSTADLICALKVPVINVHISGAYYSKPKWGKGLRRGRVELDATEMFSIKELKTLNRDEVLSRMLDSMRYNESQWQGENCVAYKKTKNFAEGLENILYICPKCKNEMTTRTKGDGIYCTHCGNRGRLNEFYDILPDSTNCVMPKTIYSWYELQKIIERDRIISDPLYELRSSATLRLPDHGLRWFTPVGKGETVLNKDGFTYIGTACGKEEKLFVPLSDLPTLLYGAGVDYEFFHNGSFYYFEPDNRQVCVKQSIVCEQLYKHYISEKERGSEVLGR